MWWLVAGGSQDGVIKAQLPLSAARDVTGSRSGPEKKKKGGQIQRQSEIRANYVAIYASAPSRPLPTQPTR
jgi:hypothetical protein